MPRPDIIFLDVGRTLLFPARAVGETYAAAARRHGLFDEAAALDAAFREAFREKREAGEVQDRSWWADLVRRTFTRVGETGDVSEVFDELHREFAGRDAWRLADGAAEIGPALRARGYRTGILSNWDTRLRGILAACGLDDGMDPIVVSGEVGAEKPDPAIYRAALEQAGTAPERALVVGDDPECDVRGPRAAGMQAIQLAPDGAEAGVPFVRSLPELLERLPPRDRGE